MKKVGILTFHNVSNYGAVFQAYALQRAVIELGYQCEIIDYTTKAHRNEIESAMKGTKKRPGNNPERRKKFNAFIQTYMELSKDKYYTERDFKQNSALYDIYLVGSDQVWNPDFVKSGKSSKLYFLPLDEFKNRIAYAPSVGIANHDDLYPYLKYIDNFDFVCTRESETAQYLSNCLNRKIEKVDDPVFLLNRKSWKEIAHRKYVGAPYLLLYLVREDEFSIEIAKKLAKRLKLRVVVINYQREYTGRNIYNCLNAGPVEFLDFIRNATVVCTSSFHATAFSIIFNIPFFTVKQVENDYRILDLINNFDLEERLLDRNSIIPDEKVILKRPNVSNKRYSENRLASISKLENALNEVVKKYDQI